MGKNLLVKISLLDNITLPTLLSVKISLLDNITLPTLLELGFFLLAIASRTLLEKYFGKRSIKGIAVFN
uniref:Uncharacterized protein n=1 Tax=Moorena producens (strain JHB) TaxID=1454205 RepID=A0A1D9G2C1_MOOP1